MPRRPITLEEVPQHIRAPLLEVDLKFDPEDVERFFVTNPFQRTLAHLVVWTGQKALLARATSGGVLKTAPVGAGYEYMDVHTGTTTANWSSNIPFAATVSRIDILSLNYGLDIRFLDPQGLPMDSIQVMANSFRSLDLTTTAFQIRNRGGGPNAATYEVTGYW